MHSASAQCKNGVCKYPSGLACLQADLNLENLNTQNANENMPNMIPIGYLNDNFKDCNKDWAWGK